MSRKTFVDHLDAVAERTPFPASREGAGQRPRPRQLFPALLLLVATFGMAVQILRPDALAVSGTTMPYASWTIPLEESDEA